MIAVSQETAILFWKWMIGKSKPKFRGKFAIN